MQAKKNNALEILVLIYLRVYSEHSSLFNKTIIIKKTLLLQKICIIISSLNEKLFAQNEHNFTT